MLCFAGFCSTPVLLCCTDVPKTPLGTRFRLLFRSIAKNSIEFPCVAKYANAQTQPLA
jgi:hypothetical protein